MYYKKILLPVDGSENAMLAVRHAVELAKTGGMDIVLFYCYGEIPAAIGGEARDGLIDSSEQEGRNILQAAKAICDQEGVSCKELVSPGAPGRAIVQTAVREGCDLIVMGSRGLSDFSGMVMGSVSHRVLRHATIPVLIVR
ncbi:universal stress protein [Desulfovibrio sp. OttesenSCG-928-G11]|nr:universal stress protein [Desulfovibrio sp. OttesenSCG-928-G11]